MIDIEPRSLASDRRRAERRPVCRKGTLIFEGFRKIYALVKNWNHAGARIDFEFAGQVPRFATLVAPTLGIHSDIQVVWQSGDRAGVSFLGK